jgi:hypothetical protein
MKIMRTTAARRILPTTCWRVGFMDCFKNSNSIRPCPINHIHLYRDILSAINLSRVSKTENQDLENSGASRQPDSFQNSPSFEPPRAAPMLRESSSFATRGRNSNKRQACVAPVCEIAVRRFGELAICFEHAGRLLLVGGIEG